MNNLIIINNNLFQCDKNSGGDDDDDDNDNDNDNNNNNLIINKALFQNCVINANDNTDNDTANREKDVELYASQIVILTNNNTDRPTTTTTPTNREVIHSRS
uniref:DekiORF4 n=1 Tax=Dendrolimus kikuchii nucleopolyhedrovirus TaxID=1219875 RepID=V9LSS6_9ABAC|nr:DekiORF4 [Dendrolimus kikuchii nucleopolyhedrovirus]